MWSLTTFTNKLPYESTTVPVLFGTPHEQSHSLGANARNDRNSVLPSHVLRAFQLILDRELEFPVIFWVN